MSIRKQGFKTTPNAPLDPMSSYYQGFQTTASEAPASRPVTKHTVNKHTVTSLGMFQEQGGMGQVREQAVVNKFKS
jgi:hypothetical protein